MTVAERLCATPCGPAIEFAGIDLSLGGSPHPRWRAPARRGRQRARAGRAERRRQEFAGQDPAQGRCRIAASCAWSGPRAPGCIGYVPQALEFDRGLPLTVDDFMAAMCQRRPAFLGLSRSRRPAIDAALERVGMLAKRGRRMGALSGGERQRVLLAQGLYRRRNCWCWTNRCRPRRGRHPGLRAAAAGLAPGRRHRALDRARPGGRRPPRRPGQRSQPPPAVRRSGGQQPDPGTPAHAVLHPAPEERGGQPMNDAYEQLRQAVQAWPPPATCRRPWPTASSSTRSSPAC